MNKLGITNTVARISLLLPKRLGWWLIKHTAMISSDGGETWKNFSQVNLYDLLDIFELFLGVTVLVLFFVLGVIA